MCVLYVSNGKGMYLEPCYATKMECFAKIVNVQKQYDEFPA